MSEQPIPDPGAWVRDEQARSHLIAAEIGIQERDRIIKQLREALRRIRDEGPSAPVAHGIARAALGDTEHE